MAPQLDTEMWKLVRRNGRFRKVEDGEIELIDSIINLMSVIFTGGMTKINLISVPSC